jgi:hypothetical protein
LGGWSLGIFALMGVERCEHSGSRWAHSANSAAAAKERSMRWTVVGGASGEVGVAWRTELRMGLGFGGRESWKWVTRTAVNFPVLSR